MLFSLRNVSLTASVFLLSFSYRLACFVGSPMGHSTNKSCLLLTLDNSAIKTQTKSRIRALASTTTGDLLRPSLIPIPSPLLPSQTTIPAILIRPPQARTLSSTTIKQVICTLQVWGFNWGRLSRSQIPQVKVINKPQSTCTASILTYSTRNLSRIPVDLRLNNRTRLVPSSIKTRGMIR